MDCKENANRRVYYPAPYTSSDNLEYYQDSYEISLREDHRHLRCEPSTWTRACLAFCYPAMQPPTITAPQIYAWRKGIKTIYYIRLASDGP